MAEPDTRPPAPRAGRREWIGLLVLALPCVLYSMDLTVLNLALPRLSADLEPSSSELLWIVDIYGFFVAGSLITMGTLGDRIGRRRLLMLGALAFGAFSVLAAFSRSAPMLIVARALLGLAGATLAPSTLSLIRNMFLHPAERATAIGVWITSYSVGGAVGPLVGGLVLQHFPWGSVFLIGVPVMLLLLVLAPLLLPEFRDPGAGRLDVRSAALSIAAVLVLIYGVKQLAEHGPGWRPAAFVAAGTALAVLFVRRQKRLADPAIDLRLFAKREFSAALVAYSLASFVGFGSYVLVGQYLQLVLGLSPLAAGLWTTPFMAAFIVGPNLAPLAARRVRPPVLMVAGLLVAAVGFALLAFVGGEHSLAIIVVSDVVFALGLSPVVTLGTDAIMGAARPEQAGAAAALSETSSELGGALGVALLGSLGTVIYRSGLAAAAPPVPAATLAEAQSTLATALAVARRVSGDEGAAIAHAAVAAFTRGVAVTAIVCSAIALATAAIVARAARAR